MGLLDDDPNFTGSCGRSAGTEPFKVTLAAQIDIQQMDNYYNGKLGSIYFKWSVWVNGSQVARYDFYGSPPPKTRKAAVAAAKRAARAYAKIASPKV